METAGPLPHCARHSHYTDACAVCRQARANAEPYVSRHPGPLPRSFGYTDNITPATFREPTRFPLLAAEEPAEVSLSLLAIRFLLRLIWPFGRIL